MRTPSSDKLSKRRFRDCDTAEHCAMSKACGTSTKKGYECEFCDYKGPMSELERHTRTHTGERPFKLDSCDFSSMDKSSLTKHIRTQTGERPFKCHLCNYRCIYSKSDLMKHIRTHTGEKPY